MRNISRLFHLATLPIRKNGTFFVFMYLLGVVVNVIIPLGKDKSLYSNLFLELFLDLYVLCAFLSLIPTKVRRWVTGLLSVVAYIVATIDLFCYVRFGAPLNPTMLLLVGETNSSEASEFIDTYLNRETILSPISAALVMAMVHVLWCIFRGRVMRLMGSFRWKKPISSNLCATIGGVLVAIFMVVSIVLSWHNKKETAWMFSQPTIGSVEHELTRGDCAVFYLPVYRLAFSIFSNKLASEQVASLIKAKDQVTVDSCAYTSPNIVLIIGESFSKHHSAQYGYAMPTTPEQQALEKAGTLIPYTDVIAPWNLTSFVFKYTFSTHVVGEKGEWCDYPLFPEIFRKAGYHVTFATNQFMPKAKEEVYDFSGGFFLNHPELSQAMFDTRNSQLYRYDAGLLNEYDHQLKQHNTEHNLIIFHLKGQHVSYRDRYPSDRHHFTGDDYRETRSDLPPYKRRILADYDNAIRYNDSIVAQIVKRFEDQDAVVIYMPDHGEECYEENRGFICRHHNDKIDYALARYEFEIPFWIYCSPTYIKKRPELFAQIKKVRNHRFMTDAIPHVLLYLAGISTPYYHAEYNILSPQYDEKRPRILKNTTDYDRLSKPSHHHAQ